MSEHGGYSGSGVSLGDGDLFGLAGLLSTVGTEALTFQHRGTGTMETVRDADVWLALHEGPLQDERQTSFKNKNKKNSFEAGKTHMSCLEDTHEKVGADPHSDI